MIIDLKNGSFIKIDIQKNEKGVYEYYSEGVLLGVYNPDIMKDNKFLEVDLEKNHTIRDEVKDQIRDEINVITEELKEKINEMEIKDIEKEAEENKALGKYLEEIGVNSNAVKRSFKINDNNKENENKKEQKEQKEQVGDKTRDPKKANDSIDANKIDKKAEIGLGEAANNIQSIKRLLEVKSGKKLPKGAYKIAVISSDQIRNMKDENGKTIDNSSTRYGLALIRKDENGKMIAEPLKKYIPQLEQSHNAGTNPIKPKNQIETTGEVEKDPIISEYRIGRMLIDMDKDHLDDMEVHFGEYSAFSNDATRTELRTEKNIYKPNAPIRGAATDPRKGVYAAQRSDEELEECKDDKKNYIDGDGDNSTKSNEHISEMAREILHKSDKISDNYNHTDVENTIKELMKNNKDLDEKEIKEMAFEKLEAQADLEHEPRGTENRQ